MGTIEKKDILKICQKAKAASRQVSLLDSKLKNEILKEASKNLLKNMDAEDKFKPKLSHFLH